MMDREDRISILIDSLFTLVSSFNTALDRLDALTDGNVALYEQHQELITRNQEAFTLAREDFFRKIIEAEVNKHNHKDQQHSKGRMQFGSDIVRKAKRS